MGPRGTGHPLGHAGGMEAASRPLIPSFANASYGAWIEGRVPPADPPGPAMTPGGFQAYEHRWALPAAFAFQERIGKARGAARIHALAARMKAGLAEVRGVRLVTPRGPDVSAGLVCADIAGVDPGAAVQALAADRISATVTPYAERHLRSAAASRSTRPTSTPRSPPSRGSPAAGEVRAPQAHGYRYADAHPVQPSQERFRAGASMSRRAANLVSDGRKCWPERMRRGGAGQHSFMATATETRDVLLALEPRPESARLARRALATNGLHEDVEHTVTLLATEIVGNAVRHAGLRSDQRIVFFARLSEDFARVEVADQGDGFDPEARADRGLRPAPARQAREPLGRRLQRARLQGLVRGRPPLRSLPPRRLTHRRPRTAARAARHHRGFPRTGRSSIARVCCGKYLRHAARRPVACGPCRAVTSASCSGLPP